MSQGRLLAAGPAEGSGSPRRELGRGCQVASCAPGLPYRRLGFPASGWTWPAGERLLGVGRRQRLCWVHRGWARPYLSSFQREGECLTQTRLHALRLVMGTTPEPWSAWAWSTHSSLRQLRKERLTKRPNYQQTSPSAVTGLGFRSPGCGRKGPTMAEPGGLSPTPVPVSVTWRRLCRVDMCIRSS